MTSSSELDESLQLISSSDVQKHVDFLASDSLAGRHSTTREGVVAAKYVAQYFEAAGLEPCGDRGTWFQEIGGDLAPNVVGIRRAPVWLVHAR